MDPSRRAEDKIHITRGGSRPLETRATARGVATMLRLDDAL
jgi:hypothetical protein